MPSLPLPVVVTKAARKSAHPSLHQGSLQVRLPLAPAAALTVAAIPWEILFPGWPAVPTKGSLDLYGGVDLKGWCPCYWHHLLPSSALTFSPNFGQTLRPLLYFTGRSTLHSIHHLLLENQYLYCPLYQLFILPLVNPSLLYHLAFQPLLFPFWYLVGALPGRFFCLACPFCCGCRVDCWFSNPFSVA